MDYLGDKLSVAHSQVSGWVGNVRRSLHGALGFFSSSVERVGRGEDGSGHFNRTNSLRLLASRSRESIRRFSLRSQQRLSLRRRTAPNTPTSVQQKQGEEEDEGKDSETPAGETDSQYGTWETGLRTDDSLTPATPSSESNLTPSPRNATPSSQVQPASQLDADIFDGLQPSSSSEHQPLAFPDTPTPLLDNSALRSKVQLGKKRAPRSRPSRAARQSEGESSENWIYKDSTEERSEGRMDEVESKESKESKEQTRAAEGAGQSQRVALFPGVDPLALQAQLKKRSDSDTLTNAPSPSLISRSPKSPFLPRAARVLPPAGGKENGEEESPKWLKELKSKKRLSQYENEN